MKKPRQECFCAHCRSPRTLRYSRRLKGSHYLQILVLTLGFTFVTYPFLTWKGVFSMPIIWALFDGIYKTLYRKDLKCPYCGFDPTWYKKDVKIARKQVEDFLKQNPDTPVLRRASQYNEFVQKHSN